MKTNYDINEVYSVHGWTGELYNKDNKVIGKLDENGKITMFKK